MYLDDLKGLLESTSVELSKHDHTGVRLHFTLKRFILATQGQCFPWEIPGEISQSSAYRDQDKARVHIKKKKKDQSCV